MQVKRSRIVAALALIVGAAAAGAVVSEASGQSPNDSVTGSVTATFPDFTTEEFDVSAHLGKDGVRGTIEFRSPFAAVPSATADVTCLVVSGSEARVGGTFRTPFDYTIPGVATSRILYIGILLHDNGPPGHGSADVIHPVVFDDRPRPPTFTPCNLPELQLFPVDSGNLVVHDADG
jgi:hypothetical protein